MKKTAVELVSVESSVYHCLLFLDLPMVMSNGILAWAYAACSRLQAIHSLWLSVSFRFGWSPLFCPAGFPSAQCPGVVHFMTQEDSQYLLHLSLQRGPLVQSGGWKPWVTSRGHCSVFRKDGGCVSLPPCPIRLGLCQILSNNVWFLVN